MENQGHVVQGRKRWYAPPVRITQTAAGGAASASGGGRTLSAGVVEGMDMDTAGVGMFVGAGAGAGAGAVGAAPQVLLLAWCALQWLTCLLVVVGMIPALWRLCATKQQAAHS